jgi:formylmethanofuran dehydrogenase subunit E
MAILAGRRFAKLGEPEGPMRCHTCDEMTVPKDRVRVAVCLRCSLEGRSVGSSG